jgi:hypothetical protein
LDILGGQGPESRRIRRVWGRRLQATCCGWAPPQPPSVGGSKPVKPVSGRIQERGARSLAGSAGPDALVASHAAAGHRPALRRRSQSESNRVKPVGTGACLRSASARPGQCLGSTESRPTDGGSNPVKPVWGRIQEGERDWPSPRSLRIKGGQALSSFVKLCQTLQFKK